MTLAAVAAAFSSIGGCAPQAIGLRPVDTGAGRLAGAQNRPDRLLKNAAWMSDMCRMPHAENGFLEGAPCI
jgi:hypothetical protein